MEDEFDIIIENDIVKFITFNGGIPGTTTSLVDAATLFGKIVLKKINSKINTEAHETHGL